MHFLEYAGHAEFRGTRSFEVERRAERQFVQNLS